MDNPIAPKGPKTALWESEIEDGGEGDESDWKEGLRKLRGG